MEKVHMQDTMMMVMMLMMLLSISADWRFGRIESMTSIPPGAAQVSIGPETKRLWVYPGRFKMAMATNERGRRARLTCHACVLISASLRFLR